MANKILTIDPQETLDYYDEILSSTAVLAWNTTHSDYTFAFYLNKLFAMMLAPAAPLRITAGKKEVDCSLYSYHSEVDKTSFFLVNISIESMQNIREMSYYNKALLIKGPDSLATAKKIHSATTKPYMQYTDLYACQQEELRMAFINGGIVESAYFDFTDIDNPKASFITDTQPGTALFKKQNRFLNFHKDLYINLLVELDEMEDED